MKQVVFLTLVWLLCAACAFFEDEQEQKFTLPDIIKLEGAHVGLQNN